MIDPQACVDPRARLGANVSIGPWSRIDAGVELGEGCQIGPHVLIRGPTRIGPGTRIYPFCSIGEDPQDKKYRPGGDSRLEIGAHNTIREYCSINRGTQGGGGLTRIGDHNWIMAYCHIAHDCRVGSHTVFANNATLAGHVEVQDHAILGGFTGVHQFCRLGEGSLTAIASVVTKDVPPFVIVDGPDARPRAINRVGLQRRGVPAGTIAAIRGAYRLIYRQGLPLAQALAELEPLAAQHPQVRAMRDFIAASQRGICR